MINYDSGFLILEDEIKEYDLHLRPSDYQTYLSSIALDLDIHKCSGVSPFFLLAQTVRFFPEPKSFDFDSFDFSNSRKFNQKIKMLWPSYNPNIIFHSSENYPHPPMTMSIYDPNYFITPIENPSKEIVYPQDINEDKLNQFCDSIKLEEQHRKGCKTHYVACLAESALTKHLGTDYDLTLFYFGLDADRFNLSGPLEIKVSEAQEKELDSTRHFLLKWDLAKSPIAHAYGHLNPKSDYGNVS